MSSFIELNAEDTVQYHLKEFQALRKEIDDLLREARTLERWVLVSVGAVLVWLYTHPGLAIPAGAFWVPFFLALFGAVRSWHYQTNVDLAADYLRKLERVFCQDRRIEGWNKYVSANRKPRLSVPALVFWPSLLGLTLIAALFH